MYIIEVLKQGLIMIMIISVPPLATAVIVGIVVSLVQSVMQLQDPTLPFALKLISVAIVLAFTGRWILQEIMQLSINCFDLISRVKI